MDKIRILKNEKLRKIRFFFRTIVYLEVHRRRSVAISPLEEQKLVILSGLHPIQCTLCGDRYSDLIFNDRRHLWFCLACYEDAHKLYPDEYPL